MSYFSHFAFLRHAKNPPKYKNKTNQKQKRYINIYKQNTKQKKLYAAISFVEIYLIWFSGNLILLIMFDFTRNGPDWQSYRSAAQQSVKPTIIKNYIEPQAQCADDLVTWLEKYGNNNPEVKFAFMCYSADGNASD